MTMGEMAQFRALETRVAQLAQELDELRARIGSKQDLAEIRMRVGGMQAQINSLRRPPGEAAA